MTIDEWNLSPRRASGLSENVFSIATVIRNSQFIMMFEKGKVLIIGDEESLSVESRQALESGGFRIGTANSGDQALERVHQESFDAALIRLTMPEDSAMATLERLKQASPNTAVIVISGSPDH